MEKGGEGQVGREFVETEGHRRTLTRKSGGGVEGWWASFQTVVWAVNKPATDCWPLPTPS